MNTTTLELTWRDKARHHLNPLHVYCRLVRWGMMKERAKEIMRAWQGAYDVLLG